MAKAKTAAEKKVTMKLFYDGYKYVDDVTIIVNGKTYIIKRRCNNIFRKSSRYMLYARYIRCII